MFNKLKNFYHAIKTNNKYLKSLNTYRRIFETFEDLKLNIGYYDFSNSSIVRRGKITSLTGWYIAEKGKVYGISNPPRKLYRSFFKLIMSEVLTDE
jgi:hypothetical protein